MPLPAHVAIIMDGNGRWAEDRGHPRLAGHRVGADSVRAITRAARRSGIRALTLYAFSSQNWDRPPDEVAGLMELLRDYLVSERDEIMTNGIRLYAIGDAERLPPMVKVPLDQLCADSAHQTEMVLTLALSYGGRESIAATARKLAQAVVAGTLQPSDIDTACFARHLPTHMLPPVDLLIRTSGEERVSNFLLWELAYAELVFSDVLWPDFREAEFAACLAQFTARERRFGKTSAQLQSDLA